MRLKQERCVVVVVVVLFYVLVSSLFEQSIKAQNSQLVSLTTALIRPQSPGSSAVREQPNKKKSEEKKKKKIEKENVSLLKKEEKKTSHYKLATEKSKARIQLHCTGCAAGSGRRESLPHRRLAAEACTPPSPASCVSSLFSCVFSACVLFCCQGASSIHPVDLRPRPWTAPHLPPPLSPTLSRRPRRRRGRPAS